MSILPSLTLMHRKKSVITYRALALPNFISGNELSIGTFASYCFDKRLTPHKAFHELLTTEISLNKVLEISQKSCRINRSIGSVFLLCYASGLGNFVASFH